MGSVQLRAAVAPRRARGTEGQGSGRRAQAPSGSTAALPCLPEGYLTQDLGGGYGGVPAAARPAAGHRQPYVCKGRRLLLSSPAGFKSERLSTFAVLSVWCSGSQWAEPLLFASFCKLIRRASHWPPVRFPVEGWS